MCCLSVGVVLVSTFGILWESFVTFESYQTLIHTYHAHYTVAN